MLALLIAAALWVASCGQSENHGNHSHEDGTEHTHEDGTTHSHGEAHGEGTAFTAAYVCPMHCDRSGSEEPGTCPACGMDYVALAEHVKDGHKH